MSDDPTQVGWSGYMPPLPADPWAVAPAPPVDVPPYREQDSPYWHYTRYAPGAAPSARVTSGWAVASLICSIAGMVPILPLVGSLLGVLFGHVALSRIKRSSGRLGGRGLAVFGLILGYLVLGLAALCAGLLVAGWLALSRAAAQ